MAVATYPITDIKLDGPRDRSYTYIMGIPAGGTTTDHCFLGPVEVLPEPGNHLGLHVSANPSTADHFRLTVYGTFDTATITASGRNWWIARGDMTPSAGPSTAGAHSGVNVYMNAVSLGGYFRIYGPARSYRFRVSGPTNIGAGAKLSAMVITNPRS